MNARIGIDCHARDCIDDEGKVECVCGLDEVEWHESNREPDDVMTHSPHPESGGSILPTYSRRAPRGD